MPFKTHIKALLLMPFIAFISITSQAQNTLIKDNIALAFENYFDLDRENIYVHLDKNTFFTNETIWFKGYVYNKKLDVPSYATTNVHLQLLDESGTIVEKQLLYSINGVFSGKIDLGKKFKSGYYYLQFYTNWMNNFAEDESFIQRIKIKSDDDKSIPLLEGLNTEQINVEFFPEGGNFISNTSNILGVKITDANGLPIPNCSIEIVDENNQSIKSVVINNFGMGRFEITPINENYKAILLYNNEKKEYNLPRPTLSGISLELNNYAMEDKTSVKIKYNKEQESLYKNETVYLVIQKNEKSTIIEVKLDTDTCKKEFIFSNDLYFSGINSIRIIDSKMNEIAQRLVYQPVKKESRASFNVVFKNAEKVDISGSTNWIDACVSASFLPISTKLSSNENIVTALQINSYLNEKLNLKRDYFNEFNRAKKFEI